VHGNFSFDRRVFVQGKFNFWKNEKLCYKDKLYGTAMMERYAEACRIDE